MASLKFSFIKLDRFKCKDDRLRTHQTGFEIKDIEKRVDTVAVLSINSLHYDPPFNALMGNIKGNHERK